ncbi:TRI33-like protein [Mya arenaria]|uniref:TRI33-like protein n=1 Tax=Mya arenaria TaxID=6604 RepID=A0ABY7F6M6_MYAAR|nr:E3 ubiquitin-protein ligase TRIM71-like [Mya arenaria]XP_052762712.1 E3 ubiquitin-protein ligase TRIM71-like [Mya arenaria]WAR17842.1 TRI33-like protein [Mya arenaria]
MAEVSGRTIKSTGEGGEGSENSSADGSIYCLPCTQDGTKISAEGFCKNCKEHLCSSCIMYHKKFGITKKHSILDKAQMPSTTYKSVDGVQCSELCPYHPMEVIKYYCPTQNTVHCGDCVAFDHQGRKFAYIPDVARKYVESEEFSELKNHDVDKEFTNCVTEIEKCLNETEEAGQSELQQIRHVRDELNAHITKQEHEPKITLNQIKESQKQFLNDRMACVHAKKSELGTETVNLLNSDDDIAKLFIKGKQFEGLLAACKTALADIKEGSARGLYRFQRNPLIDKLIQSTGALNVIVEEGSSKEKNINKGKGLQMVRSSAAKSFDILRKEIKPLGKIPLPPQLRRTLIASCITVLSDERLLITNNGGLSVTMLDTKSNLLLSSLALSSEPWDFCLVSRDKGVVTMPYETKNMQFIYIGDTELSLDYSISVSGNCYGVDCFENKLYVCYGQQKKIEAMTMDGKVIHEVSNNTTGKYIFNRLKYIKVQATESSNFIYASDAGRFTITQLNLSLQILKNLENPKLECPFGLEVVDSTQLLVCGKNSGVVFVLNTSNGAITRLLGIHNPASVCFCRDIEKLYVGVANKDVANDILKFDIK